MIAKHDILEDEVASFRAGWSLRARATLAISGGNDVGEAFFYQPTPKNVVFVAVTGVIPTIEPRLPKDVVVVSSATGANCANKPPNNPVFNPSVVR